VGPGKGRGDGRPWRKLGKGKRDRLEKGERRGGKEGKERNISLVLD